MARDTNRTSAELAIKKIPVFFFRTEKGNEPVRDWLKGDVAPDDRKAMGDGLHEVRTNLPNRIARVLFYVDHRERMILLHGFIQKTRKTPPPDIAIALARKAEHEEGLKR
jgi:phage-related protein